VPAVQQQQPRRRAHPHRDDAMLAEAARETEKRARIGADQ